MNKKDNGLVALSKLWKEAFDKTYGPDPSKWGAIACNNLRNYYSEEDREKEMEKIRNTNYPSLEEVYPKGFINPEILKLKLLK